MPKTAIDPFFATNNEPVSAGRHTLAVSAAAADLPHVTSSLIVVVITAGAITIVGADDPDGGGITLSLPIGVFQFNIQVRAVTAVATGIAVYAVWNQ